MAGQNPRFGSTLHWSRSRKKKPRLGGLQWRCTGDSIRICSKVTILRLESRLRMSTRSSVLTTCTADLVLCLIDDVTRSSCVATSRVVAKANTLCRNVFLSSLLSALPLSAIRSPLGLAELALLYPSWSCPNNEQQDPAGMNCCKPQAAEKPASARWEGRSFWLCTDLCLLENRPELDHVSKRAPVLH